MSDRAPAAATVGALLAETRRRFREAGLRTPELDARLLVADAVRLDAAGLILRSGDRPDAAALALLAERLRRRLAGEPVHRILGRRAFCEHEFALSPETLEPRPDTETLVDLATPAIAATIRRKGRCLFADVGTGSGAIAVSLLARLPEARAVAIDISEGALATARSNAAAAGVGDRFMALASDYLEAIGRPLDMVVSNPPYIPTEAIESLDREVRDFDPRISLDGGVDGLDAYRAIAERSAALLSCDGGVALEIGCGQKAGVTAIFEAKGLYLAASADDLGGVTRALLFRGEVRPA